MSRIIPGVALPIWIVSISSTLTLQFKYIDLCPQIEVLEGMLISCSRTENRAALFSEPEANSCATVVEHSSGALAEDRAHQHMRTGNILSLKFCNY